MEDGYQDISRPGSPSHRNLASSLRGGVESVSPGEWGAPPCRLPAPGLWVGSLHSPTTTRFEYRWCPPIMQPSSSTCSPIRNSRVLRYQNRQGRDAPEPVESAKLTPSSCSSWRCSALLAEQGIASASCAIRAAVRPRIFDHVRALGVHYERARASSMSSAITRAGRSEGSASAHTGAHGALELGRSGYARVHRPESEVMRVPVEAQSAHESVPPSSARAPGGFLQKLMQMNPGSRSAQAHAELDRFHARGAASRNETVGSDMNVHEYRERFSLSAVSRQSPVRPGRDHRARSSRFAGGHVLIEGVPGLENPALCERSQPRRHLRGSSPPRTDAERCDGWQRVQPEGRPILSPPGTGVHPALLADDQPARLPREVRVAGGHGISPSPRTATRPLPHPLRDCHAEPH